MELKVITNLFFVNLYIFSFFYNELLLLQAVNFFYILNLKINSGKSTQNK